MAGSTSKTAAAAQPKAAEAPPREALSLQEKFIKLREAVPSISQKQHSDGVKYKFAKIFDVYELLTPAMNQYGVNFDIVAEKATRHAENGDEVYYHTYQQQTRNGARIVWVYEADITIRWTNADDPEDKLEVTLHAIGTKSWKSTPPGSTSPTARSLAVAAMETDIQDNRKEAEPWLRTQKKAFCFITTTESTSPS